METTTIYNEKITLVNGDLMTIEKNKYFDLKIRAYENIEIEIKIKKINDLNLYR